MNRREIRVWQNESVKCIERKYHIKTALAGDMSVLWQSFPQRDMRKLFEKNQKFGDQGTEVHEMRKADPAERTGILP